LTIGDDSEKWTLLYRAFILSVLYEFISMGVYKSAAVDCCRAALHLVGRRVILQPATGAGRLQE
jgi:hypothetical protein